MKKLFSIFVSLTMLLSGCGSKAEESGSTAEQPTTEPYYINGIAYEITENYILVDEESRGKVTVSLGNLAGTEAVKNLDSGDEVEIAFDGYYAESYPAQVHNIYDIRIVKESERKLQYVRYNSDDWGQISFLMPSDWRYEEAEPFEMLEYGIDIYSDNNRDKIRIAYSENFGVCGTGLTIEETEINGMPATMGVYDKNKYWEHIIIEDTDYYILNMASNSWCDENMDDVQIILDTLEFM